MQRHEDQRSTTQLRSAQHDRTGLWIQDRLWFWGLGLA